MKANTAQRTDPRHVGSPTMASSSSLLPRYEADMRMRYLPGKAGSMRLIFSSYLCPVRIRSGNLIVTTSVFERFL